MDLSDAEDSGDFGDVIFCLRLVFADILLTRLQRRLNSVSCYKYEFRIDYSLTLTWISNTNTCAENKIIVVERCTQNDNFMNRVQTFFMNDI